MTIHIAPEAYDSATLHLNVAEALSLILSNNDVRQTNTERTIDATFWAINYHIEKAGKLLSPKEDAS